MRQAFEAGRGFWYNTVRCAKSWPTSRSHYARAASSVVEHLTFNQGVPGPIPGRRTNGEHPKVAAERLGHSSTTMTMDVYLHVLPTMQQAATERVEGLLSQAF